MPSHKNKAVLSYGCTTWMDLEGSILVNKSDRKDKCSAISFIENKWGASHSLQGRIKGEMSG